MSVLWVRTGSHSEPGVLQREESSSHEYVSHGFLLHGHPASPRVLSAGHSGSFLRSRCVQQGPLLCVLSPRPRGLRCSRQGAREVLRFPQFPPPASCRIGISGPALPVLPVTLGSGGS